MALLAEHSPDPQLRELYSDLWPVKRATSACTGCCVSSAIRES